MSDKKTFKIYQILTDTIDKDEKDPQKLIDILVWRVNAEIIAKGWDTKFLIPNKSVVYTKNFENISLKIILYKATHTIENMYNNFFVKKLLWQAIFNKIEDIFICFVIIDEYIYFFSSSHTFAYFLSFVNEDFSIKIASKIITWKVKYEKSISITWETLTSDLIFRWLKWFSRFDNLWKVVKGFIWEIDRKKSKKIIDLVIPKDKKYFCEIWNSFTLRKSLNFDETIQLIKDLHFLYLEEPKSDDYTGFQMLEKINPRFQNNKILVNSLKKVLSDEIFSYYNGTNDTILNNYELIPPREFIEFIECASFTIQYKWEDYDIDWLLNLKDIVDFIKVKDSSIKSAEVLYKILEDDITLYWYNSDWEQKLDPIKKDLTNYIVTEFEYSWWKYFCINWDFFEVKKEFIEILDKDLCDELLNDSLYLKKDINDKLLKWNLITSPKETEWKYNEKYLKQKDFIVLDRVFYRNIEFCDLLYNNSKKTFLFHNKKWFDWDMRILSEQVSLSAITLSENRKQWNSEIIKNYYKSLEKKKSWKMKDIWNQSKTISESKFLTYFDLETEINYVLWFTYNKDLISIFKSKDKKKIMTEFNKLSIIAKYELLILIKRMRTIGVNFYITQIETV